MSLYVIIVSSWICFDNATENDPLKYFVDYVTENDPLKYFVDYVTENYLLKFFVDYVTENYPLKFFVDWNGSEDQHYIQANKVAQ